MAQNTARVQSVEDIITYTFIDNTRLIEALTAAGNVVRGRFDMDAAKRLALLGDSVLKTVIRERWYQSGTSRGMLKILRTGSQSVDTDAYTEHLSASEQSIESNNNLYRTGLQYGIDQYIVRSPGQFGALGARTVSDCVEAILGAAYLDGGMQAVRQITHALGLE